MHRTFAALAAMIFCTVVAAQPSETKLPDGDGKQVTERICGACHGIATVVTERHDKDGWQKIIDDMVARGADGTEEELKMVREYLTKHFGPKAPNEK